MNVELLRKIQAHILEEPKRLWLNRWKTDIASGECIRLRDSSYRTHPIVGPACGTVACISGWAQELADPGGSPNNRRDLLDLYFKEAERLFHDGLWPDKFKSELAECAPQSLEYAQIVCARIDHFISTKGRE